MCALYFWQNINLFFFLKKKANTINFFIKKKNSFLVGKNVPFSS